MDDTNKKRISRLREEYQSQLPDIMDETTIGKAALMALDELSLSDCTLMMLYADLKSYRKVAQEIGCSHQSVKIEIERIKKIMKERIPQIDKWL